MARRGTRWCRAPGRAHRRQRPVRAVRWTAAADERLLSSPVSRAPRCLFPGRTDGRRSAGTVTSHPRGCRRHRAGQPFHPTNELAEVADGTAEITSFANVAAFTHRRRPGASSTRAAPSPLRWCTRRIRAWTRQRLDTAVFTHGHIDHVFGVELFDEEAHANGWRAAAWSAHEAIDRPLRPLHAHRRLQRGHQPAAVPAPGAAVADRLPLARRDLPRPRSTSTSAASASSCTTPAARPTTTPGSGCRSARSLCTGDLFIWASPNCGNPQKVQRYAARLGASPCATMADLDAELLLPGHGLPIVGADARAAGAHRHRRAARHRSHDQTLALMNEGAPPRRDRAHRAGARPHLLDRPYLQPDLRRARVRRAQRLAPLRRLVRRRPGPPQAGARRRARRRARRARRRRRTLAERARRARRGRATCASPATSPSSRRRPPPTTPPCTASAPRSSGSGPGRALASWRRASSAGRSRVVREGRRRARLTRSPCPRPARRTGAGPPGSRATAGAAG